MEGRVFVSSWKKTADGYRVWVKNNPKLAAEGKTFEEADEALWGVIIEATGDGENTREYDPPIPVPAEIAAFLEPHLVQIVGNEWVGVNAEGMFADGGCSRCGFPRGGRTDKPLASADIGPGDAGFASLRSNPSYGIRNINYFSEKFLDLLKPEERERFTWRKVERQPRSKKAYYELVACEVVVPEVAVKGLPLRKGMSGWHCELCGYATLPRFGPPEWPMHYVCRDALPAPLPSCFAVDSRHELMLCASQERWLEMIGKPGANGIITLEIGVAPHDRCDRAPETRELAAVLRRQL